MIKTIAKIVAKGLPLLVVLLAAGQIWLANELAGMGTSVWEIDQKIESLREENDLLTQQVASSSSLLLIEEKASQMGFVEPDKSSYIMLSDLPLALGQLH